jgi:DNA repair exonuclease SbcCD ATPase subunit
VTSPSRPEELPEESSGPPRGAGGIWRFLARGRSSEERLEEFLAERRRELEEQTTRFDEKVADLEHREELLRDSRASVERLLRLGTRDLEARESELADLVLELTEREAALRAAEAEHTRRRSELGAVELRRAALERREQALAAREEQVSAAEARFAEHAVRSSVEQGEEAASIQLAFVPGPSYRLVEIEQSELERGSLLEIDGTEYAVGRIGPSPLPSDRRRCAYLVQGVRGSSPSGGSS